MENITSTVNHCWRLKMSMLELEDVSTFKKLGINLAAIGAVAAALILVSMYYS